MFTQYCYFGPSFTRAYFLCNEPAAFKSLSSWWYSSVLCSLKINIIAWIIKRALLRCEGTLRNTTVSIHYHNSNKMLLWVHNQGELFFNAIFWSYRSKTILMNISIRKNTTYKKRNFKFTWTDTVYNVCPEAVCFRPVKDPVISNCDSTQD